MENRFKLCKYNYIHRYRDKVICLNGITGSFVVFKKLEYDTIFNKLIKEDSFPINYPSLYKKLLELKFLITNEFDEIAYIKEQNNNKIFLDTYYWLTINPTIDCNFNCWYCIVEDSNTLHEKIRMPDNIIGDVKMYVKKLISSNSINGIHLDWFGGEPLLFFNEVVYPISKYTLIEAKKTNRLYSNHITTNGYLINKKIIKQFNEIKLNSFQITLDGNEEKHNKVRNDNSKPTYRQIIKNIKDICNFVKEPRITLRINYDKNTLLKIDSLINEFSINEKEKISINFQRVWQVKRVEDDENELLKKSINKCIANNINVLHYGFKPGKYYTCYSDKYNHAVINYDGKVYKCTARDYNEKNCVGKLTENGKIEWIDDKIYKRFSANHFDHKQCMKCKILPLCYGPCSQNSLEFKNGVTEFSNICMLKNSEINLNSYLITEAKNRKLI